MTLATVSLKLGSNIAAMMDFSMLFCEVSSGPGSFYSLSSSRMKSLLVCICSLLCLHIPLWSQSTDQPSAQDSDQASNQFDEPLRIGAYCAIVSSINTATIPDGWKTGVIFQSMPDIGANLTYPAMSSLGLYASLDLGFNSIGSLAKPYTSANDSNTMVLGVRYLSFCPAIALPNASLGLRIGIPLGASLVSADGSVDQHSVRSGVGLQESSVLLKDQCQTLFELRLGGMLPLLEDAQGSLHLSGAISYQLNSSFKDFALVSPLLYDATKTSAKHDPRPISLSVGLRYLFELGR